MLDTSGRGCGARVNRMFPAIELQTVGKCTISCFTEMLCQMGRRSGFRFTATTSDVFGREISDGGPAGFCSVK